MYQIPSAEYHEFYETYVRHVNGHDPLIKLAEGEKRLTDWYGGKTEEQLLYRYAEGKWTPKEVLGHIIDAERLFAYRAFRISRGDQTPLAGFDQDPYIPAGRFNERTLDHLMEEYLAVRLSTRKMIEALHEDQLPLIGNANGLEISLRAQLAIVAGHELHHLQILEERYQ